MENYKGKTGFFLKKFLISDAINLNKWRVTWAAIKKDLHTFVGQPTVLTPDRDHPAVVQQHKYEVGKIIDVGYDENTHKAWQVTLVTDKNAQELIRTKKIRYGSPTVHTPIEYVEYRNQGTASEETILHRFLGKHDALVAEPAFGKMIDNIPAICEGDGEGCANKLLEVKAETNDSTINQITVPQFMKIKAAELLTRLWGIERRQGLIAEKLADTGTYIHGKKVIGWMTINGQHVPILEGETKEDATDRFVKSKESKPDTTTTSNETKNDKDSKKDDTKNDSKSTTSKENLKGILANTQLLDKLPPKDESVTESKDKASKKFKEVHKKTQESSRRYIETRDKYGEDSEQTKALKPDYDKNQKLWTDAYEELGQAEYKENIQINTYSLSKQIKEDDFLNITNIKFVKQKDRMATVMIKNPKDYYLFVPLRKDAVWSVYRTRNGKTGKPLASDIYTIKDKLERTFGRKHKLKKDR